MTLDTRKTLSLLLIPVFIALISVLLVLNVGTTFNPPILLLIFKSLFLGLIPLYVAYIAYKSFQASGSTGVLLNGTGMLLLGLTSIAAGVIGFLPASLNSSETVQSTNFPISAILMVVGTIIALSGIVPERRLGDAQSGTLIYGGCILYTIIFSFIAVRGVLPPFFIPDTGYTFLREFLLINAIEFFALASLILLFLYFRKREEFHFWFSIGLALIALGLVAVIFSDVPGSLVSWLGRTAQYLGAVYILFAFMVLKWSAQQTGIPIGDMLSRFFGEAEANYKTLIETATDAIIVFDAEDRVIVWNQAAENLFGYTEAETIGSSFFHRIIPDEFTDIIKRSFQSSVLPDTGSSAPKSVEISAKRKDGSLFPMDLACSWHMVAGTWMSTCIMRDITERKRVEAILTRLSSFPERNTNPIIETDISGHVLYSNPSAVRLFPDLQVSNNSFLANLENTSGELIRGTDNLTVREVWVGDRCYQQSIHYLPDIRRVRIYGMDITDRKKAEYELKQERDNLNSLNEELSSIQKELRQNIEELSLREQELIKSEAELKEALSEKEVLLSEIHHRVKNNLTAFISLLSLDGSYEDTEGGRALRKDLQNRARSMALIHETLYRTGKFSNVDMETYLNNLISQIAGTYMECGKIQTVVDVRGVTLDIARATTAGLIINELLTNSFKYAFPPGFDCMAVRGEPCTIRVSLAHEDGMDVLTVADNGRGLPDGFDPLATKSLGLKLVTFLARHQLQAEIAIRVERGTEFSFHLKNTRDET
jgi:PAS domain S-box-containing protein